MILAFVAIVVVSALLSIALVWFTGRTFRANVVDASHRRRRHDAAMLENRIALLEADVSEPIEDVIARAVREVENPGAQARADRDLLYRGTRGIEADRRAREAAEKWVTLYHPDCLSKPTRPNPARDPEWR